MGDRGGGRPGHPLRPSEAVRAAGRTPGPRLVARPRPARWRRRRGRRPARSGGAEHGAGRRRGPSPAGRPARPRCGPGWPRCRTTPTVVLVHDAARPAGVRRPCSPGWSRRCAPGADAAVPVVRGGRHPPPAGRRGGRPRRARRGADPAGLPGRPPSAPPTPAGPEATDDATLVEQQGGTVVLVDGDPSNRKITDPVGPGRGRRACCSDAPEGRHGLRRPPHGRRPGPALRARRGPVRRPPGPGRPQRRRRGGPRGGRRAARRGRAGRHRRALPRHRPGLGRRRQHRAARRGDPPGAGGRLGAVERRLHGRRRRAEAGAAPAATCRPGCPPRSARR